MHTKAVRGLRTKLLSLRELLLRMSFFFSLTDGHRRPVLSPPAAFKWHPLAVTTPAAVHDSIYFRIVALVSARFLVCGTPFQ